MNPTLQTRQRARSLGVAYSDSSGQKGGSMLYSSPARRPDRGSAVPSMLGLLCRLSGYAAATPAGRFASEAHP